MKYLKKFESQEENFDESFNNLENDIKNFISESGIDAEYDLDREGPTLIFMVKKVNKCFNSEEMKNQFSNDMMYAGDGMAKGGFMSDYTTIDDMHGQIRVIDSIVESLSDIGMDYQRAYIAGEFIYIEMMPNI